ncbi:molybdopterin-dependent oxidoreductase [Microbacterium sp. SORGH_AS_0421]|uniref:molybdopterin-dependent oxidoreductase n=1 Tax=Microbacterium sp. SORGH_AS_0421 TaxID=3041768 RepID=UPI00278FDFAE|nr:molybdopterin-dependent oxidoreductase [Microbacterium sp. SORGH_AS_0421]MDQ1175940.1 DMSO/TMAO reductase YedYZ molybdopterin-dependent catalytic subunit [Microbacterium sp. SORGH_AS_0421]
MTPASSRRRDLAAIVASIAATVFGAGLGELAAAVVSPTASPFAVIGGGMIDLAPAWAKDLAIDLFGTGDKAALLVGIAVLLLIVAGVAGVLERRKAPWGRVVLVALGVIGAVVSMTRADAGTLSPLPSLVAGAAAALVAGLLVARLRRRSTKAPTDDGVSRRSVLALSGVAVMAGALAAVGSVAVSGGARAVSAVRSALRLPSPATTTPVPAGADLGIDGLGPIITASSDFYRIDTALVVPQVDPATWTLRVHGMVEQEVVLRWDDLVALPQKETVATLACVSDEVGGSLIGNARWLGVPLRDILERAKPTAEADMVLSHSVDGFTASTPLEALTDGRDALLAIGMNGEPLPIEHGFPVRMVVPGLYGYVSATKWVSELEVTRYDRAEGYWTSRGWSERGPVKLQSRIDVPRSGARVGAGDTVIAGVAWQTHVGVSGVEVQIDDGPWQAATLATAISADTWVQWSLPWNATSGSHTIRCRAISADGQTQTSDVAAPAPDGATGWDERTVSVA